MLPAFSFQPKTLLTTLPSTLAVEQAQRSCAPGPSSHSKPFPAERAYWSQCCWIQSGWSWTWVSHGTQGSQGSCNQLPEVWPASLHAAKALKHPSLIMAPKVPTEWDPQWLSLQDSQAELSLGAYTPQGAWPPTSSCSTVSALGALSALGVLRTKWQGLSSFPVLDFSLPPPSPLCTGSADSEDRRILRGDPDLCQAQLAGGLGIP